MACGGEVLIGFWGIRLTWKWNIYGCVVCCLCLPMAGNICFWVGILHATKAGV